MNGRRYDAVLFDFFGTLTKAVARGPAHDRIALALRRSPAQVTELLNETFYRRASGEFGSAPAMTAWLLQRLSIRPTADLVDWVIAARTAALRADTVLRADAVDTLIALRMAGLKLAVVSDCGYELPTMLPGMPIAPLLHTAIYSVDVGACKPDARMYRTACERLEVRPDRCLYVGDGGSQELEGALAFGLDPVRLAAADLAGHLLFGPRTAWAGAQVTELAQVIPMVTRRHQLV